MRVTTEMMVTSSLRRLSSRLEKYEDKQRQLATGRRVDKPSDDPSSASRALALRSAIRARTQEKRNAVDAITTLDRTDVELQNVVAQVQRAQTLALRAASEVGSDERDAIAAELRQIQEAIAGIANTEVRGRPLFSGFGDASPVAGGPGAWTYDGDAGQLQRRVTDQDRVVVNRTAPQVFGDIAGGTSLFHTLDDLIAAVDGDATDQVRVGVEALEAARKVVGNNLAITGAAANRVEDARTRTEGSILVLQGELAEVQDVDLEEAIMGLRVEEVAYEATLQALGRALPPSLVTFMR